MDEQQTLEGNEFPEEYTSDDMASALYPIYQNEDSFFDVDTTINSFKTAYEFGKDKWSPEAEEEFDNKLDAYRRANDLPITQEAYQLNPPYLNDDQSEEEKEAVIETWRHDAEGVVAGRLGDRWILERKQGREQLDALANNYLREAKGKDTGVIADTFGRLTEGGASVFDIFGAEKPAEFLKNLVDENPQYDDSILGKASEVIGQAAGQQGIPLAAGAGAAAGALALGAASAPALVVGGATMVGLQAFMNYVGTYKDTYDTVYDETGSNSLAAEAAVDSALSSAAVETVLDSMIAGKMIKPFAKGLSAMEQKKLISGVLAYGAYSAAVEGPTEFAQSVTTQAIESEFTGRPIDYAQAREEGYYGALAGGVIGGAYRGAAGRYGRRAPEATPQEETTEGTEAPPPQEEIVDAAPSPQDPFDTRLEPDEVPEADIQRDPVSRLSPVLTPEQEIDLASKLEAFSKDERKPSLQTHGFTKSSVPVELLDTLGLKAIQTQKGVRFVKRPIIQNPIEVAKEESADIDTEALNRLRVIPSQLNSLRSRLSQIPTEETLQQRIRGNIWQQAQVKKALKDIKNPTGFDKLRNQLNVLIVQEQDLRRDLKRELMHGVFSKERAAIEQQLGDLELEYNIAQSASNQTKTVREVLVDEGVKLPKEEVTLQESKTPDKTTSEPEPKADAVLDQIQMTESPLTPNTVVSAKLSPELRDFINYTLSGFGFNVGKSTAGKIHVFAKDELDSLAKLFTDKGYTFNKSEVGGGTRGFAATANPIPGLKKGYALEEIPIAIAIDTSMSPDTQFTVAAHEVGHVVTESLWQTMPENTRNKIWNEFLKVRDKAARGSSSKVRAELMEEMGAPILPEDPVGPLGTPVKKMQLDSINYIIGRNAGFREYLSNRIAEYILNPQKKAVTEDQSFFKQVASAFQRIWKGLVNRFGADKAPTLTEWLDETFRKVEGNEALSRGIMEQFDNLKKKPVTREASEEVSIGKSIGLGEGGNQRERTFSKRVSESTPNKNVKKATAGQMYTQKSPKETMEDVNRRLEQENIDESINNVLKANLSQHTPDYISAYGIAVQEKLERLTSAATDPDVKANLERKEADFVNAFAEKATNLGRAVQMFTQMSKASKGGFSRTVRNQITEAFDKAKVELPDGWETMLKDLVDEYYPKIRDAQGDYLKQTIGKEFSSKVRDALQVPSEGAGWYFWYGNILSGGATQFVNILSNGADFLLRTVTDAVANPKDFTAALKGISSGLKKGLIEAKATALGKEARVPEGDKFQISNRLDAPIVRWENKYANKAANTVLKFLEKFPFRTLAAEDAFFYRLGYERQAALAASRAVRESNGKLNPVELAEKVSELLGNTDTKWEAARTQAEKDVTNALGDDATDLDIDIRTLEIIDSNKPSEIRKEAKRKGKLGTYTQRPEGVFGVISDQINALTSKIPKARLIFPFTNVVANVLSQSLDFSPIGVLRARKGSPLITSNNAENYSDLERRQRATAGVFGTLLASALYAIADSEKEKEDPYFAIYGAGPPKGSTQRENWLSKGALPYTIKIGDSYYKYSELPVGPILGVVGALHDSDRWDKSRKNDDIFDRSLLALTKAASTITDMGFLRSIVNITDVMKGEKSIVVPIASAAKGLVPYSGMMRDIASITNPDLLDYKDAYTSWLRGIPYLEGYGRKSLNGFGEPIDKPNRFISLANPDPVWQFLAKKGLSLPGISNNLEIGKGSSASDKAFMSAVKNRRAKTMDRLAADMLTEDEAYTIHKIAGPRLKSRIRGLMRSNASTEALQKLINSYSDEERRRAKMQILANPSLVTVED